ncbi:MAG: nucleotidyltransferase family protein [Clostridia bacterium]|nr:nucleotidyltransferase family protein [Clostridia bacterium]
MKTSGIIAEFNPLHGGHKYLIGKAREKSDGVIAIMSGNFVQRGDCAVFPKFQRAADCVTHGIDLCIELPCVYALSSAQNFARGAVSILNALGCVNYLFFGSEAGDISALKTVADSLDNPTEDFKAVLSKSLREGLPYPAAVEAALSTQCKSADILSSPNNTLAVEYLRALKFFSSTISPVGIKREGGGYNSTSLKERYPSASALRAAILNGENPKSLGITCEGTPTFIKAFDVICAARLKTISKEELCRLPDCNEEIAVRLKKAAKYNTFNEIVQNTVCKSYTESRIRRILCNMMVANTFTTFPKPTYIRPLAFNKTGAEIIKQIKQNSTLPVIDRGALLLNDDIFRLECRCSDIYSLACGEQGGSEITQRAVLI